MVRQLQYLPPTDNMSHWMYEIRNRYKWLLQMGGEKVWLLKRRWVGEDCPNMDPVRNTHRHVDKCEICYGTGFIGGFYPAVQIMASLIYATTERIVRYEYGMRREYEPKSWTLWKPILRNKDLIVRKDGKRFWIQNVTPTRWRGIFLRQNFDLAEVEPDNIVYTVPVL